MPTPSTENASCDRVPRNCPSSLSPQGLLQRHKKASLTEKLLTKFSLILPTFNHLESIGGKCFIITEVMSAPRPKPWEVSSGQSSAAASGQSEAVPHVLSPEPPQSAIGSGSSSLSQPTVPERPTSLQSGVSSSTPYSYDSMGGYGSTFGSSYGSGLGGYGGYGGYSRLGGYGSMYGSGLGGYGMGGYGMGGYGMGGYGMNGMYGPQNGEGGGFAESTQATFQLIESVIGAFAGFAQMLEATYMATHSSFFTMVSVAEQFGNLKNALGSFLGIYALIKYCKRLLAKITGGRLIKDTSKVIDAKEFAKFEAKQEATRNSTAKRISLKPLLIFLAMAIGTPYLLNKLVLHLAKKRNLPLPGQFPGQQQQQEPIDVSSIDFGRALYDFVPENPQVELPLKTGDLVAILSKLDPSGRESQWWRVRSRSGQTGYIPGNYVEIIVKKPKTEAIEQAPTA